MNINLDDPVLADAIEHIENLLDILAAEGISLDALAAHKELWDTWIEETFNRLSECQTLVDNYNNVWREAQINKLEVVL